MGFISWGWGVVLVEKGVGVRVRIRSGEKKKWVEDTIKSKKFFFSFDSQNSSWKKDELVPSAKYYTSRSRV